MNQNAIRDAMGALKLVPMFVDHPSLISRACLVGASHEALQRLEQVPAASIELHEAFRAVHAVCRDGDTAYVTATTSPERPYGAVVVNAAGHLVATACGKTIPGLAELIRLRLPPQEGRGEAGP
ncbi:hypothetical protein D9M70_515790 [compost metagenome]